MSFLILLSVFLTVGFRDVTALQSVPNFVLNLDIDPLHRWDGAVGLIVQQHGWSNSFGPVLDLYFPLLNLLVPDTTKVALHDHLQQYYPDVLNEVVGIGLQLKQYGCSYGCDNATKMAMFVYFYEIAHALEAQMPKSLLSACTGILSLPTDRSKEIIHGRNMDEEPAAGRNLTLNIAVMRGGVKQYTFVDWTWIIAGFATSAKMNGLTLELNWNHDGTPLPPAELTQRLLDPKTVPSFQSFRIIQEKNMTFEQAVSFLMTTQYASPFYVIMSAPGRKGAILTIMFNSTNNVAQYLNDTTTSTSPSFMVQTNFDRWLPDPKQSYPIGRRTRAEQMLTMLGQGRAGTELGVWMAMTSYPVHNPSTMFSALMGPDKEPEVFVWDEVVQFL